MRFAELVVNKKHCLSVLVLCAMRDEATHVTSRLVANNFLQTPNNVFFRNRLVVDVKLTGIGTVHAAANASLLMHTLNPDIVINVGCAGAHDSDLRIGDVVVGKTQISTSNVVIGDHRIIPYGDRDSSALDFPSDETLVAMAQKAGTKLRWSQPPSTNIITASIGSSDTWMDSPCGVKKITSIFGTVCEDMEAAAIALVAKVNSKPFLSVKDISNSVFLPKTSDVFDGVVHDVPPTAGKNAAIVVAKLLKDISELVN